MLESKGETICILLASYNGEKFISDQLESLLSQTYANWKLFIRDDGSTDKTLQIVNRYVAKDPRISLVCDSIRNSGSCQNFARLLDLTRQEYKYFMFCDQDDVWLPTKIEETFALMLRTERQHHGSMPILAYSNFQYVYDNLKIIESKKRFESTKVKQLQFPHLLAQNPAYGCTMMLN